MGKQAVLSLTFVEDDVYKLLECVAAQLEEPWFSHDRVDLEGLVRLSRVISMGLGGQPEYAMRNGCAVSARDPSHVICRPVCDAFDDQGPEIDHSAGEPFDLDQVPVQP